MQKTKIQLAISIIQTEHVAFRNMYVCMHMNAITMKKEVMDLQKSMEGKWEVVDGENGKEKFYKYILIFKHKIKKF